MEQQLLETGGSVQPSIGPTIESLLIDPSVMLRKGIYDKVAAKIVL